MRRILALSLAQPVAVILTVLVLPVRYTIVLPERGHGRMPGLESAPLPEVA